MSIPAFVLPKYKYPTDTSPRKDVMTRNRSRKLLRLPEEMLREISAIAEQENISASAYIRRSIARNLQWDEEVERLCAVLNAPHDNHQTPNRKMGEQENGNISLHETN
jgi:tRNA C32,U32 (ribose-2'-O)-methylase TrmJ